jgi:hypothetical protein
VGRKGKAHGGVRFLIDLRIVRASRIQSTWDSMSDFERIFGAGADLDSAIDCFSRSAKREAEQNAEQWRQFTESVFVDARIASEGYSLFFESYDAAIIFENASRTYGEFDYSFVRRREGTGFRVIIDPDSHTSYFSRSGRGVITKSLADAQNFQSHLAVPIFYTERKFIDSKSASDFEQYGLDLRGWAQSNFKQLADEPIESQMSILDLLDNGRDVLVFGGDLRHVLELRARFVGWSATAGFSDITSLSMLRSFELPIDLSDNSVVF